MKLSVLLPLAATATAIVWPDAEVMQKVAIEDHSKSNIFDQIQDKLPSKDQVRHSLGNTFSSLLETSKNALDDALDWTSNELKAVSNGLDAEYFDAKAWIASSFENIKGPHPHPRPGHPHHGPPNGHPPPPPPPPPHGAPPHGPPPPPPPPPHGPPSRPDHGRPHHPPHHKPHKSNHTVYELINASKYTTKLAELINKDSDLVELLNSTKANFTIFAPTDAAFEKIPDHGKEPPAELIKKVLSYHVSSGFYPAGRILVSRTIPTLLEGTYLSTDPKDTPQRISTRIGLRGLTLNFYSRVVAVDIFGSNGVIHGIDSLLLPPPSAARIVTLLPSEFSTLELALHKTGLFDALNSTSNHLGGTLFAPSNWAFKKLGPKINAFLFSEYGRKYLTALLSYHVVANETLYSDAFYGSSSSELENRGKHRIPKGKYHVDLPTLLEGKYLSVDIGRFGRLIDIRINGFAHVAVPDGVAKDGVIHGLSNVLIPPKAVDNELVDYNGEDLTVEDLKDRLKDYVEEDGDDNDQQEDDKHDL